MSKLSALTRFRQSSIICSISLHMPCNLQFCICYTVGMFGGVNWPTEFVGVWAYTSSPDLCCLSLEVWIHCLLHMPVWPNWKAQAYGEYRNIATNSLSVYDVIWYPVISFLSSIPFCGVWATWSAELELATVWCILGLRRIDVGITHWVWIWISLRSLFPFWATPSPVIRPYSPNVCMLRLASCRNL